MKYFIYNFTFCNLTVWLKFLPPKNPRLELLECCDLRENTAVPLRLNVHKRRHNYCLVWCRESTAS